MTAAALHLKEREEGGKREGRGKEEGEEKRDGRSMGHLLLPLLFLSPISEHGHILRNADC